MLSLHRLVSADSHVLEPADLWTAKVPASLRDVAPRVVERDDTDTFAFGDRRPQPIGAEWAAGDGAKQQGKGRYADAPPAGWDPHVRVKDQDTDSVACEVLYPTLGLRMSDGMPLEHRSLYFDVYNEWLGEFCRQYPERFRGVAMVDVDDIDVAGRQIEGAKSLGLSGVMFPAAQKPHYYEERYDPLWERAEGLGLPVSFHVGTGEKWVYYKGRGAMGMNIWRTMTAIHEPLVFLIWSGTFDRYPKLQVGFVEGGISWVPSLLDQLDHIHSQHQWIQPKLARKPSEYWRTNCFATFERSKVGLAMRDRMGVSTLMWANDYPHAESTWPNSVAAIEEDMGHLPQSEVDQICFENTERVYPSAALVSG